MTTPLELGAVIGGDDGRILVGTCSWTDKTLTHETDWYPARTMSAEDRLAFYAARFPIAEIDSTYYGPPREQQAGRGRNARRRGSAST